LNDPFGFHFKMFGAPLVLLLPLIAPGLSQRSDPEYNRICPRGDDLVTLPSGNKIRYLCDDCLIDPVAEHRSVKTIEECADLCSKEDCKATIWDKGLCFTSKLTYIGPSPGSSPGCIWMTAQTCFDSGDDCGTCLNDKEECEKQKRKCEDDLARCKPGDDECEKKARKCKEDLTTCEDEKAKAEKKERKCQQDLITCEDEKNALEKEKRQCQADLRESQKKVDDLQKAADQCTDDLEECKKSGSGWGGTEGKIKCNSGSLTTATLNGNKWLTLCGFIINDVKGGVRGLTLKECVESCSTDDKCRAITYDDNKGECYKAHKFKTGDMRYSNYYHTVLRLT
ncbi:hypothetical protein ANOM_009859, partial [Aspergillus nomiae NRRL 13137]